MASYTTPWDTISAKGFIFLTEVNLGVAQPILPCLQNVRPRRDYGQISCGLRVGLDHASNVDRATAGGKEMGDFRIGQGATLAHPLWCAQTCRPHLGYLDPPA